MDAERWQQIERLYHAALARPATERGALSAEASAGVCHLQERIGAGGMGEVYWATDTKLNRPVPIKFLSTALADTSARRRFQREAQLASSLNHPHILTVHDAGEVDGRQYIVTEFVDGGTLRNWVLVVEMKAAWLPCRLVPFDGSSTGKLVGPSPAQCTDAGWSPDGAWMYFTAMTANGVHIWRERFSEGTPEQVTFGASTEEGVISRRTDAPS